MIEKNASQITESTNVISEWSIQFLQNMGVGDKWIHLINVVFLLVLLAVIVFVLQFLVRYVLNLIMRKTTRLQSIGFIRNLQKRKFAHFLAMIIPYSVAVASLPIIFEEFPKVLHLVMKAADIFLVFFVIWLLMSLINAFGDTLKYKVTLRNKPIDSYVQVIKIFLYFIGFIVTFSILSGKDATILVGGLGAMSAVLMLVFKDTILGFVASIQLSANDMVRIGDWVSVPKHGADGDVTQITLTTVKIRNFDNTITTVPPYSLVSDSFQNWRRMKETGSRRIKRAVYIKQSSIRYILNEEVESFRKIHFVKDYIDERQKEIQEYNTRTNSDKTILVNGRNLTNIGLFRKYLENYLKSHPQLNQEMTLMVRQLAPSPKGIPMEIYAFAGTTIWEEYEGIMADVFDHIAAAVKYFDLELFEDISNPLVASISQKNSFKKE